ncbi:hypothetical protein COO91_04529 [Nostoc flagelliforme CCNUN1]|uniref:Uncharacterized protein n=1 Tax=Nostoc flagelliforme CCNUN1 TaxID=2038116 RepID=A0A2K8SSX3_9NOSO|nr:hypothetical protein COO91_04529 [Nostoc flagelliforme CCNUN1]
MAAAWTLFAQSHSRLLDSDESWNSFFVIEDPIFILQTDGLILAS